MGDARNLLMALSGDACIVIGGRAGTISEVCLAWLHKRPLLPLVATADGRMPSFEPARRAEEFADPAVEFRRGACRPTTRAAARRSCMTQPAVLDLKAFVPARNFVLSRQFYLDLGFTEKWGNDQACELQLDGFRFLLQNFYVKEHAENFMMHLMVENADEWWGHIQSLGLAEKYSLSMAKPPTLQPGDFACCTSPTRPACCGTSPIGAPRAINEDYLSRVRHRGRNHSVQPVRSLARRTGPDAKGFILELFSTRIGASSASMSSCRRSR